MRQSLAPLSIAILALLVERPMHPYEMSQTLRDRRDDLLVKLTTGSLYRHVDKLAADGLIHATSAEREGNRPERTTYAITNRGRTELRRALSDEVRSPKPEYPIFPLALAEAHSLGPEQLVADLTARVASLKAAHLEMEQALNSARHKGVAEVYLLAAQYNTHKLHTDIVWLSELVRRIESKELTWPDPTPPTP